MTGSTFYEAGLRSNSNDRQSDEGGRFGRYGRSVEVFDLVAVVDTCKVCHSTRAGGSIT